jgi:hypothetical protein
VTPSPIPQLDSSLSENHLTSDRTLPVGVTPSASPQSFLPPIPIEYLPKNIMLQQQHTEQVAPIVAAMLYAQNTNHIEGKQYNAMWDGQLLTLTNKENQVKMIASVSGQDEVGNPLWKAEPLPLNSPGLSEIDVTNFQEFVPAIKSQILRNYLEQSQPQSQAQTSLQ